MSGRHTLLAIVLAGCELFPGDGISRNDAIRIAQDLTGLTNIVFIDAVVENADAIEWHGDQPPMGRLWLVRFRGTAHACGPAPLPPNPPNPCLDQPAESIVYLDYETGAFISTGTTTNLRP